MSELDHFIFNCFKSFLLGIVQGITEFLPISSTAHLKVVPYFLGWKDPGVSISASLQLGSAFAILLYFRKEINIIYHSFITILRHQRFFMNDNTTFATYIFLANIPIFILGLFIKLFYPGFSDSNFRGLFSISIVSIVMALLLAISEIYGDKNKSFSSINLKDIVLLAISQSLAIIPGVSRSGITLTAALFSGIKRETAAKLSFLVGIPAISISGLVEFFILFKNSSSIDLLPIIIGIISSFFSSIISIHLFLRFLVNNNTFIFVFYRLAFGVFILSNIYI